MRVRYAMKDKGRRVGGKGATIEHLQLWNTKAMTIYWTAKTNFDTIAMENTNF